MNAMDHGINSQPANGVEEGVILPVESYVEEYDRVRAGEWHMEKCDEMRARGVD